MWNNSKRIIIKLKKEHLWTIEIYKNRIICNPDMCRTIVNGVDLWLLLK
jgi:hypothetical protein